MIELIESLVSAEFIRSFAWTLIHSLWQGALLALLAGIILILLRKYRPGARYTILYFIFMLLPVICAVTFIIIYNPDNLVAQPDPANAIQTEMPANEGQFLANDNIVDANQVWFQALVSHFENNAKWLVMLWFVGFIFFLARFGGSIWYVYSMKTHKVIPAVEYWQNNLRVLSIKLGLHKKVSLVESAMAKIPMTIGYLKPMILLPVGTLSGVPPQQIEAILLHELAHILRKDYLLNILQSIVELIFFYHPLTWWISNQIRNEREHICDDLAIGVHHDQINYIKALTTMEELNSKTPQLASALTGNKKQLLARVQRILSPAKVTKGFGEGMIAFILLITLVLTFSLNALSVIPTSFDLSGGESGEKVYNILPYSHLAANPPDTIISKSKSGKVTVTVYTDSTNAADEKELQIFVETLDDQLGDTDADRDGDRYQKEVIIIRSDDEQKDSTRKITVIKSGGEIKIIKGDTVLNFSEDFDTSFVTDGGFQFYGFEIPDMPDMPEIENIEQFYFNDNEMKWAEEYAKSAQEYELQMKDIEREMNESRIIVVPPDAPRNFEWTTQPPQPPLSNAEKIIRQELRDDGLTERGRKYVVEIDPKAMYINGEKQPKETFRKYLKLVESLENARLAETGSYKLIF
jgi:beta-lactamase regulating signal transducer with metallopeptidase domain